MRVFVKKIKKWAEHSPLVFGFTLSVVIISSLLTIWKGGGELLDAAIQIIAPRTQYYKMADKLSTDVRIAYVESILGPAQIKNNQQDGYSEYIFINKYFYTQALVHDEQVMMYAVSTRDPNFNPEFRGVFLGKTKFAELDRIFPNQITEADGVLGGRRLFYNEKYWGGNPSDYQWYVFSLNDAVLLEKGYQALPVGDTVILDEYVLDWEKPLPELLKDEKLKKFREETAINTYAVTSPSLSPDSVPWTLYGPDNDQVRLLDKTYYE